MFPLLFGLPLLLQVPYNLVFHKSCPPFCPNKFEVCTFQNQLFEHVRRNPIKCCLILNHFGGERITIKYLQIVYIATDIWDNDLLTDKLYLSYVKISIRKLFRRHKTLLSVLESVRLLVCET